MKKQLFNSAAVKTYTTALLTSIILMGGSAKANATESADSVPQAKVTYLGVQDEFVTFNVHFDNKLANKFSLQLTDGDGHLLFHKKFSDKYFNKTIYLKGMSEDDQSKVKFTIQAGKDVIEEVFDINNKTTFVQEYVVTKL